MNEIDLKPKFFDNFSDKEILTDLYTSLGISEKHSLDCLCCHCKYYMALCEEARSRNLDLEVKDAY